MSLVGFRLSELAGRVNAKVLGEASTVIYRVATLQKAGPGDLAFFANSKYRRHLASTKASAVIVHSDDVQDCPAAVLIASNVYATYARLARLLNPDRQYEAYIHPSAVVESNAHIAPTAYIGPNTYIGSHVVIGERSVIGPGCQLAEGSCVGQETRLIARVTLCHDVVVGDRVLIHPGAVIGSDGFGIAFDLDQWIKVPQLGGVVIGNDVEIGANTTIDRGALDDTVIEEGVKLDNQIQIAHNVHIGAHTAIAGCVGIAGTTKIGKYCLIGGSSNISGHIEIADHVHITAASFVTKSITKPGTYSSGIPSQPNDVWNRAVVRLRKLDELFDRVQALELKRDP